MSLKTPAGWTRPRFDLGELVDDHHLPIAKLQLDLQIAPVGNADARCNLGAEGLGIPVGGAVASRTTIWAVIVSKRFARSNGRPRR
jgi:hypothetical protein